MPTKLNKIFANLKSTVVGTKTQKVDQALDDAVKDIIGYKAHSGRNGYIDLMKTVISKSSSGINLGMTAGGMFGSSTSGPAAFGQGARLMRYRSYEAIVSNINYAHRALSVIVDNILSPDDITKVSLDVKPREFLEDEQSTTSKVKRVAEVIEEIDLEKKLHLLVKNTLKYGDFFCEIADSKVALTSKSILSENHEAYNERILRDRSTWTASLGKNEKIGITIDYSSFNEQNNNSSDENQKLKNLNLVFHKPNFIVKLQSALFPVCFGYLVFPQIRGIGMSGATLEDEVVNNICTSILKNLQDKIPQMSEFKDDEELKDIIKFMVKKSDPNQALDIRYVPPDRMVHFHIPSEKYYPYGESIFDCIQYSAKVLMSLETALAVQRLSRSTEKRKIGVEVGLPRDAKKAVEAMKEEFRKRKVSLDSFGTVDTIPCFHLNTDIQLTNGKSIKLNDLINYFNQGHEFEIYAFDHKTGLVCPDKVTRARVTGKNVKGIKITLDNGYSEVCTLDHLWMRRDGSYTQAKDLKAGDSLMPLSNSYKVVSVEFLDELIDVGDIETKKFHNFALSSGVFVHNSMITTFEDVYIPQKDGKAFVDISTFNEGNVDIRSKVDELKFIRDSIVSALSVPPSFIGIEENLSNKCLALSTEIKLLSGNDMTLQTLIKEFNDYGKFNDRYTYSYDKETGEIVPGKIVWAGMTRKNAKVVKVTLDNGKYEIVTPDHHYMLRNGNYVEAQKLEPGDSLMSFKMEHKVVSVEFLDYTMNTGDITVEKYHNFAVSSGVIVSNSALSEENVLFARAVVTHQKYLSHQINDLLQKVFDIISPEEALQILDNVLVHLPTPHSLQYEREARYMNELTGLIEGLERIGVPKEYSKRKYLANFDWEEIKKYEIDEKVETTLDPAKKEEGDEFGGMGGGMGGGL